MELALILAVLLGPLVFGMIEMGYVFNSQQTLSAASREGARMGSNLANGGGTLGCGSGQSPSWATVDQQVIAAVERSLTGAGTVVTLSDVSQIRIWKSTAGGLETTGSVNVWTYTPSAGPVVDGDPLEFSEQSVGWQACARNNVIPADSMGITVRYTYRAKGPLRYFMPGFAAFAVTDSTVMALNATR